MKNRFGALYDLDARADPYLAEYELARDLLRTADWSRGLEALEDLAHRGSIMSILLVADAMWDGWLYDQDLPGAEAWFRVAAESGSACGLYGLGRTHLQMGRFKEAIEDFEAAIARNYPPALDPLALMYFRGDGVPVNKHKAAELWQKGAELGHLPSKRNLVRASIRGELGIWRRIWGLLNAVPLVIEISRLRAKDPFTDRLR